MPVAADIVRVAGARTNDGRVPRGVAGGYAARAIVGTVAGALARQSLDDAADGVAVGIQPEVLPLRVAAETIKNRLFPGVGAPIVGHTSTYRAGSG